MIRKLIGSDRLIDQTRKNAFNLDTILLAHFMHIPYRAKTVVDIGTGNGVLMLYLADQTNAKIIGIEIQEEHAKLAQKNVLLNGLEHRLSVICDDVKHVTLKGVDCIISNPPFFKVNELSKKNIDEEVAIARHELKLTFEALVIAVSNMLKYGGYFYFIHRPDRLSEMIKTLEEHDLTVKRIRFVHPYQDKEANHVLIAAMKNGEYGTKLEPPLILYKEKHVYSDELAKLMEDSDANEL